MTIEKVNLKNIEEIKEIAELIFYVFNEKNKSSSTEYLINKYNDLYGEWYDYDKLVKHFQEWNDIFLKAVEDGKIVWVIRWKYDKIINLYVDPNQQWKWMGKSLILKFEELALEKGIKKIYLKSSDSAESFYKYMWYIHENWKYLEKHF